MKPNHPFHRRILPPPTREQVAALAYAIWEDRGRPAGSDVACWVEAERELKGSIASTPLPLAEKDIAAEFAAFRRDGAAETPLDDGMKPLIDRGSPAAT